MNPAEKPNGFRPDPRKKGPPPKMVPFYSPDDEPTYGQDIHLSLTSGHTAIVRSLDATEGQGTPLHPMFHKHAVSMGALPVGASTYQPPDEEVAPNRTQIITKRMTEMLDGNDPEDFTREGRPDLNQLQRRCGFRVTREEADKVWAELKAT